MRRRRSGRTGRHLPRSGSRARAGPKVRLDIARNDEFKQITIDAILSAARTDAGEIGDGKIFVTNLEECIRIPQAKTAPRPSERLAGKPRRRPDLQRFVVVAHQSVRTAESPRATRPTRSHRAGATGPRAVHVLAVPTEVMAKLPRDEVEAVLSEQYSTQSCPLAWMAAGTVGKLIAITG